jgi:tetratricopeptide (TPR) repeat protein
LKRFALVASVALALGLATFVSTPRADARRAAASPSPSPAPSAVPTATPEPPQIAIPRLEAALKANPNDDQAALALAWQFLQVGNMNGAAQLSQRLLQTGHKTSQVYYIDGAARETAGDMQGALADFEHASNLDPTNLGILEQLADIYDRAGRFSDAERVAKRSVSFNATNPESFITLGNVYAAEGHYDDARAQFEDAAKLDPTAVKAILQIASSYAAQNNIPMALTTMDRALKIDPTNWQVLVQKADLYAKEHDDAHVGQAYDDAVVAATSNDEKVAILTRKAQYYMGEKKNDVAQQILQQAIATYPTSPAAYSAYGAYLATTKQDAQAEAQWQKALSIDKDYGPALLQLGELRLQSGKYNDGITYLKHYVSVSPDEQGYQLLGQAYSYVHDYKRAHDSCFQSFQIHASADSLGCIGGADFEMKNYNEGAQAFDLIA